MLTCRQLRAGARERGCGADSSGDNGGLLQREAYPRIELRDRYARVTAHFRPRPGARIGSLPMLWFAGLMTRPAVEGAQVGCEPVLRPGWSCREDHSRGAGSFPGFWVADGAFV